VSPFSQYDPGAPYKQFLQHVEGLLDRFSPAVAFATAPLTSNLTREEGKARETSSGSESEPEDALSSTVTGKSHPKIGNSLKSLAADSLAMFVPARRPPQEDFGPTSTIRPKAQAKSESGSVSLDDFDLEGDCFVLDRFPST
jgi:hypothetical protein